MSESLKKLRSLTDEELISKHDELAKHTQVGINHYLNEIYRRDNDKISNAMLKYTKWITIMTVIILIATIINIFF